MKMFQIKQQPYRDFHLDDGITKGGDPTCRYEYNNRNNGRTQIRKKRLMWCSQKLDKNTKA